MRTTSYAIQFVLAALIVIFIGGLTGWYYFVHRQIASNQAADSARGDGVTPSFGSPSGSAYQNAGASVTTVGDTTENSPGPGKVAPRLWHVSKNPVAGAGFASTTSELFFAETSTGNVLEADPSVSSVDRLTNTLMPKIFDAQFDSDGSVVMRVAGEGMTETYAASISTTTESVDSTSSPETLKGVYLPQNISALTIGPSHSLVYVIADPAGGSALIRSDWKGGNQKKILVSAISGWDVNALSDGTIIIAQKPADSVPGFAYSVSANGTLSPVVENAPGMTILPRAGGARIYGTSDGSLNLYAQVSPDATPVHLSIQTTADKCVWANGARLVAYCAVPQSSGGAQYLSNSYEGVSHSTDTWYQVDVSAGTATQLYAPDSLLALDVEKPSIDANNLYIAFTNAADNSLWMLRIAQ